jgi:hypothetical protein
MDFILKAEKITNDVTIPKEILNKNDEKTNWKYKRFKPNV